MTPLLREFFWVIAAWVMLAVALVAMVFGVTVLLIAAPVIALYALLSALWNVR
jgi:hypothetical protein